MGLRGSKFDNLRTVHEIMMKFGQKLKNRGIMFSLEGLLVFTPGNAHLRK